jgi:hypothetical protein
MIKRLIKTLAAASFLALVLAAPAAADFGFKEADLAFLDSSGSPAMGAGSHPFAMDTTLDFNSTINPETAEEVPDGEAKDLLVHFPAGLVGTPDPVPTCSNEDFLEIDTEAILPACKNASAVGLVTLKIGFRGPSFLTSPVYNLVPPPGVAAKIGFIALGGVPVTIDVGLSEAPPHNLIAKVTHIPQAVLYYGSRLTVWGVPADPVHDPLRGNCLDTFPKASFGDVVSLGDCPVSLPEVPYLTMPRSCGEALHTGFEMVSWQDPSTWVKATSESHDGSEPPQPLGVGGCSKLAFSPHIAAQPTSRSAESPSGLDVDVEVADEGLTSPGGTAGSDVKKAVVTLPEGVTVNPSQAEGLDACSEVQFDRERSDSAPGQGCPSASKIGTVEVESPLLKGTILHGSLYVAEPYTNRFGSLIALFMTIKDPELGVYVGLAGKVEPDPKTGRLRTTFDDLPQLPFNRFHLHFREGGRSPLVTPPRCGTYTTEALFTPWANPADAYETTSSFTVTSGVGGGACPAGGVPPFKPVFEAGSANNNAGSYSSFYMRLIRADGEQDMTKFSSVLPPGVLGSLKGVGKCPEGAVEAAKVKTGRQEQAAPSCPAASEIGRTLAGAGVGGALTYVPGKIYLAGPYKGAPLSVISITPAVAGPFDAGTVVVRLGLDLNPRTAEVEVDGAASDPIPHILKGIPLKLRDLRVYVDRSNFTLNPTSCDPSETKATLFGGFLDVFSSADDVPVDLAARYQAANCLSLGFKPTLDIKLSGGTKRGDYPALRGTFVPRAGDANLKGLVLRLPHSAFLEQSHIRTICTRVQFAAKACPPGAIYGHARAWTPLLDEPLEGPVYLRSSSHPLPDFVAELHGLVDIEAVARIDSKNGGIRATFADTPDAPLTKVVVSMQGGKKGLIVNSRDLCAVKARADARFAGHNGKQAKAQPSVRAECGGKRKSQGRPRGKRR